MVNNDKNFFFIFHFLTCLVYVIILNISVKGSGGGGGGRAGAIIRGRRLMEGRLLFEEILGKWLS